MSGSGYGILEPTFWTRGSGKLLRGHPQAQAVCLYLFSAPTATMLGLYYLPVETIRHDVGCTHKAALQALGKIAEVGIAIYDEATETVYVRTMAARRLWLKAGQQIGVDDGRLRLIRRMLSLLPKSPMLGAFYEEYGWWLRLPPNPDLEASRVGGPTPVPTPPPPPPPPPPPTPQGGHVQYQDQGQDHSQEQEQIQDQYPVVAPAAADAAAEPTPPPAGKPVATKSRNRSPRNAKPPAPPESDESATAFKAITEIWIESFRAARGVAPVFTAQEGKQIKLLLKKIDGDVEKTAEMIRTAFQDRWWVTNRACLGDLLHNPNRFLGKRSGPNGQGNLPLDGEGYRPRNNPECEAALGMSPKVMER